MATGLCCFHHQIAQRFYSFLYQLSYPTPQEHPLARASLDRRGTPLQGLHWIAGAPPCKGFTGSQGHPLARASLDRRGTPLQGLHWIAGAPPCKGFTGSQGHPLARASLQTAVGKTAKNASFVTNKLYVGYIWLY